MGLTYIAIDLETSGLDSQNHQILEFGAIIEDTENQLDFDQIPKFHRIIAHDEIIGSPYALMLNQNLIKILAKRPPSFTEKEQMDYDIKNDIIEIDMLTESFYYWIKKELPNTNKIIVAGKNFAGFDKGFLDKVQDWAIMINISHRYIDPASRFVDFTQDNELPSLDRCMKLAGVEGSVTHDAIMDAWDVIRVLRTTYTKRV